jgi:4-alpha-glucanotransferase
MRRHHIDRSYVAQYQMVSGDDKCLEAIPVHAVAAVNTHDMHPFSAFWKGIDIDERQACGVLRPELAVLERQDRGRGKEALVRCLRQRNLIGWHEAFAAEVYRAICRVLAGSDAEILLLSLDDLAGSTHAQNIPGTCTEHPNWQRRNALTLEQLEADSGTNEFLKDIALARTRQ